MLIDSAVGELRVCEKPTALGISRSGGARDPQVFQYTLQLLVLSLRLAPAGLALRFAPDETVLCAPAERDFPSLATVFSQTLRGSSHKSL
ncbi:MAG: hypothetical protein ACREYE_07135 [Gammaproteobacteria bacterium]